MALPNFVACADDCDEILFYGEGDTPDEAFDEFINGGEFEGWCDYVLADKGADIEVYIYTVIEPDKSDWPDDEFNPNWMWVLDKKAETRIAKAV